MKKSAMVWGDDGRSMDKVVGGEYLRRGQLTRLCFFSPPKGNTIEAKPNLWQQIYWQKKKKVRRGAGKFK